MATGGYAGADVTPKRQPQVEGQLQELESAVEDLGKEIENLAGRLTGVSRSQPPSPIEKDGPSAVQTLVQVAEMLRGNNERIRRLVERVSTISGLLEI